jgi:hypothetical protein
MGLSSSTGWLLSGTADFSSPGAGSFCWSGDHRLAPQAPSADRRRADHLSRHTCPEARVEVGGLVLDRDYFLAGPRERGDPAIPISTGAFLRSWGDAAASLKLATALNNYVVVTVVPVPSVETVEAVKLSEKRHPSRRVNELRVYGVVASNSESLAPRGRQIPPDGLPAIPTPSPRPDRSRPAAGSSRFPWP